MGLRLVAVRLTPTMMRAQGMRETTRKKMWRRTTNLKARRIYTRSGNA